MKKGIIIFLLILIGIGALSFFMLQMSFIGLDSGITYYEGAVIGNKLYDKTAYFNADRCRLGFGSGEWKTKLGSNDVNINIDKLKYILRDTSHYNCDRLFSLQESINNKKYCIKEYEQINTAEVCKSKVNAGTKFLCDNDAIRVKEDWETLRDYKHRTLLTPTIDLTDSISVKLKHDIQLTDKSQQVGCIELTPILKDDSVSVEIISQPHLIKGYNNKVKLKIINNLDETEYNIEANIKFKTPNGDIEWIEEKNYFLNKGENIIEFPLNHTSAVGELDINFKVNWLYDGVKALTWKCYGRSCSRHTNEMIKKLKEEAINYFTDEEKYLKISDKIDKTIVKINYKCDSKSAYTRNYKLNDAIKKCPNLFIEKEDGIYLLQQRKINAEYIQYNIRSGILSGMAYAYYKKDKLKKQIATTSQQFLISNMPTFADVTCNEAKNRFCPDGYSCMQESKLMDGVCVLTEVYEKETPCQVIGCPTFEINGEKITYECSANGYCSQVIIAKKDCSVRELFNQETNETEIIDSCGTGMKCDINNNVCVDEVLFDQMLSCKVADDCPTLCQGQIISCIYGRCKYEGECKTLDSPTCSVTGCPDGYKCVNGNCKKESLSKVYMIIGTIAGILFLLFMIKILKKK